SFNKLTQKYNYRNGLEDVELKHDFHKKYIFYYIKDKFYLCDPDTLNIILILTTELDKITCVDVSDLYIVIGTYNYINIYKKINNKYEYVTKYSSEDITYI